MGGKGSGRKQDIVKKLIGFNQPVAADVSSLLTLPNLSGTPIKNTGATGDIDMKGFNILNVGSLFTEAEATNRFTSTDSRGIMGTTTDHELRIQTNSLNAIVIDKNQNVGLGTNSPDEKLQILGNARIGTEDQYTKLTTLNLGVIGTFGLIDFESDSAIFPDYGGMSKSLIVYGPTPKILLVDSDTSTTAQITYDQPNARLIFNENSSIGIRIGGPTNYVDFEHDASQVFYGSAGLIFGTCYGNHIGWSQANAVQNTWYNISDADMVSGPLNNVTHDGSGKLTVGKAGMYLVSWSSCLEVSAANIHIEAGIEVTGSGSANAAGQAHVESKFANEEEHIGSSTILDLAANATLEVAVRTTDAGTPTISIQAINLTCTQVGGT